MFLTKVRIFTAVINLLSSNDFYFIDWPTKRVFC